MAFSRRSYQLAPIAANEVWQRSPSPPPGDVPMPKLGQTDGTPATILGWLVDAQPVRKSKSKMKSKIMKMIKSKRTSMIRTQFAALPSLWSSS